MLQVKTESGADGFAKESLTAQMDLGAGTKTVIIASNNRCAHLDEVAVVKVLA